MGSFIEIPLEHGNVHHDNLIFKNSPDGVEIYLIDWDCAGYGRMGEDAVDAVMEAFVYTSRDVSLLPCFRKRIIEGYCKGARRRRVDFVMNGDLVRSIFALAWGFRIVSRYLYYHKEESTKRRCVEILQGMLNPDW